ncbi:unnamed protein product [Symbiodinium necroappetens]|uniref:Uncharacterized protein n=1 Tax=Symbiodinium necroappetens TaxID=1628268 RepID=A0A812TDA1_9DINO|nr:unnamed protein product [Symbiodinium necroappetens]
MLRKTAARCLVAGFVPAFHRTCRPTPAASELLFNFYVQGLLWVAAFAAPGHVLRPCHAADEKRSKARSAVVLAGGRQVEPVTQKRRNKLLQVIDAVASKEPALRRSFFRPSHRQLWGWPRFECTLALTWGAVMREKWREAKNLWHANGTAAYASANSRWVQVVGHASTKVDIAWLRRGSEGAGEEDEYLSSTGSDELQFTRLPAIAVTLAANRPERAGEGKVARWLEQLGRAEECSRHFRNLRKVCNHLSQSSTPRRDPLEGMAQQLAAMRMESEARMTALSSAAEARATAGGGLSQQLTSSSEGFQAEIASMQQEQQALEARLKELRKQREDLANQLKVVDEQIDVALAAQRASAERERQVKASAQRVAGELQRELSIEEVEARKVGDRQRLLLEAGAASRDIEELLATRAEATAARFAAHDYLAEQQPKAAEMCLQSEKERGRALEELLAGWHAEVWGPDAKELAKDAQMVMKLKSLHARAAAALHQAWKETVQLAAESLGDGSALGEASQDISRAAERYKELQKEVKSNVDRMASWIEADARELCRCLGVR